MNMKRNMVLGLITLSLAMMELPSAQSAWPFWGMGHHATRLNGLLKKELKRTEEGLMEDQGNAEANKKLFASPNRQAFYLSKLQVRVRPYMQFQLPGIAKLKVFPILEMHFIRKVPKGWKDYKPADS